MLISVGPKQNWVPISRARSPQLNLDPRFKVNSIVAIRIGSVIDHKGFGRHSGVQRISKFQKGFRGLSEARWKSAAHAFESR